MSMPLAWRTVAHANVRTGESKERRALPSELGAQGHRVYDKRGEAFTFIEKRIIICVTQEVIKGGLGTLT